MKNRIVSVGMAVVTAMFTVSELGASPVGSNDVARAIGNWRHRRGTLGTKLGEKVRDVRKVEWKGVSFHVVRFEGGGHLIAPTDTRLRPVVMFSGADDIDLDERNPALALIAADIGGESVRAGIGEDMDAGASNASSAAPRSRNEREWAELLDDDEYDWRDDLDDVCVGPLVKTKWNQREDESGRACYSWYTPNGWYCGCVATALAQVMKYFEWPKGNVAQFTSDWTQIDGVATSMTTQGGSFDWENMPLRPGAPGAETTDEQRKAIGKLMSDVGILAGMNYRSGGSGSQTRLGRYVLTKTVLGYSNAMMSYMSGHRVGTEDDFRRVMISNFNAKRPVTLGIEGHSIVGDGYGYNNDGTLYYHLNFGLSGSWNAWYSTPVNGSNKIADNYTYFKCVNYNIYTTEDPSLVILSGRVKDKATGKAVAGQRVVAYAADGTEVEDATTDEHGIYSMLVLPGTYTVVGCNESQDGRSEYSGSADGNALRCVTMENNGRDGYHSPYGEKVMGNCADCDIAMETIEYEPEAEVAVGEVTVGTDFAEAVVPVTAKVVHYGQTATSAKVIVTLTPLGGGSSVMKEFEIGGDFDAHEFQVEFEGLTAGGRYDVSAKVVMNTDEKAGLSDVDFGAAREFTWFDESASSFSAARWTGAETTVTVEDGNLSIVNAKGGTTTFTPESKDVCAMRVVIKVRECGCYAADRIPDPNGPAAIATVAGTGDMMDLVVWGGGKWNKTGIAFTEDTANCDVTVDLDFHRHFVRYSVDGQSLGTYSLSSTVGTVSSVAFKGSVVLSELDGTAWDSNLVKGADGTEYANVTAARLDTAKEPLEPLWKSTWPVGDTAGSFEAKDPNRFITPANGMTVVKREDKGGGVFKNWYAKADPADIGAGGHAEKYIETTVELGLAQAITDDSVVKIDGFAVADGKMTFKVEVGQEEVMRAAIKSKVEISETLETGWRNPDADEIVFDETKHEIAVTPKSKAASTQKPEKRFVRIWIPIDG